MFVFIDDTVTTEIYTYLTTRSLLDALPISRCGGTARRLGPLPLEEGAAPPPPPSNPRARPLRPCLPAFRALPVALRAPGSGPRCPGARSPRTVRSVRSAGDRTEEHTSELQSLIRNSYALFLF